MHGGGGGAGGHGHGGHGAGGHGGHYGLTHLEKTLIHDVGVVIDQLRAVRDGPVGSARVEDLRRLDVALDELPAFEQVPLRTREVELWRELGDRQRELEALFALGDVLLLTQWRGRDVEAFTRALELSREAGERAREARALTGLGAALNRKGDFAEGLDTHQRALRLARECADAVLEYRSLCGVGEALFGLDRLEEAAEAYGEALALPNPEPAGNRAFSGRYRAEYRQVEKRIELLERNAASYAVIDDFPLQAECWDAVGAAAMEISQVPTAVSAYERAAQLWRRAGDPSRQAASLMKLAELRRTWWKQPREARRVLAEALAVYRRIGDEAGVKRVEDAMPRRHGLLRRLK